MSRWRAVVVAEEGTGRGGGHQNSRPRPMSDQPQQRRPQQQPQHQHQLLFDVGGLGIASPSRGDTKEIPPPGVGSISALLGRHKERGPDPGDEVELPDFQAEQKKGKQKVNGEWKWLTGYSNPLVEEFYVFFNSTNRHYVVVLNITAIVLLLLDIVVRWWRRGWLERYPRMIPPVLYARGVIIVMYGLLIWAQVQLALKPFHKSQHGGGFQTATIRRRDLASGLWSERIGFLSFVVTGFAVATNVYNVVCFEEEKAAGRTDYQTKIYCIDRMPDNICMIQLLVVAVLRLRIRFAVPALVWVGLSIFTQYPAEELVKFGGEYDDPIGLKVGVEILITFAFVVVALLMEYFSRQRFEAAARLRQSAKRAEKHRTMFVQTMRQLFPRIDHLSQNKPVLEMSNNCLISCYQISDFPFWTTQILPRRAVSTLERLFTLFDEWCTRLDVDKLTTIGDSYLAASNLRHSRELHTAADPLFELALVQQQRTARIARDMGMCFEGQVAIHAGRAAGVVLGTQTLRYEVFGEAVSTVTDIVLIAPPGGIVASAQARRCSSSLRSTFSPLPSRVSEEAEERFPLLELLLLEPRPLAPLHTQKQRYTNIFHQQRSPQATTLQPSPQTQPLAAPLPTVPEGVDEVESVAEGGEGEGRHVSQLRPAAVLLPGGTGSGRKPNPSPAEIPLGGTESSPSGSASFPPSRSSRTLPIAGLPNPTSTPSGGGSSSSMTSYNEDLRLRYLQQRLLAKRRSLANLGTVPLALAQSSPIGRASGASARMIPSPQPSPSGAAVDKLGGEDDSRSSGSRKKDTQYLSGQGSPVFPSGPPPLASSGSALRGTSPTSKGSGARLSSATGTSSTPQLLGSPNPSLLVPRAWQEEDFICDPRWFVPKSYSLSATEAVYRRFLLSQYMGPHAAVASFFCMFCALCVLIVPGNTPPSAALAAAVIVFLCIRLMLTFRQHSAKQYEGRRKWSDRSRKTQTTHREPAGAAGDASPTGGATPPIVLPNAPMVQSVSTIEGSADEGRQTDTSLASSSGRSSGGRSSSCWHRFAESAWRTYFTLQGLLCLLEITFLLAACHLQNSSLLNGNTTYYAAALLAVVVLDTVGYPVLITIAFIAIDLMIGITFVAERHGGSTFIVVGVVIVGFALCVGVYSADLERRCHFEAVMLSQGKRGEMEREVALHEALLEMLVPAPFIPAMIKKIEQSETEQIQVLQWLGELCVVTVRLDAFNSVSIDTENPAETLQAIERLYSFVEAALHVGGEVLSKIASFGDTLTIAGPISAKEGWKGSEYMFDSTTASDDDVIDEKLVPQFGRTLAAAAKPVQPLLQLAQGEELLMLAAEGVIKLISSLHESFGSTMTAVATCDSAFVAVLGASRPSMELLGNATRVTRAAVEAAPQGYVGITEKFHRLLETRVRSALTTLFAKPQTWRLRGPGSLLLHQWCPTSYGALSESSLCIELSQNSGSENLKASRTETATASAEVSVDSV